MNWYEYESTRAPTWHDVTVGRQWTFYFKVPYEDMATFAPATKTDVSALHPFVDAGCVGITGIGARIVRCYQSKPIQDGYEMAVEVIEPLAYS